MTSKRNAWWGMLIAAIVIGGTVVGVSTLRAEGAPEMDTLVYTGRLVEDGVAVDGTRDIRITLWSDPTSTDTAAHRLCRVVPAADTMVQDGYFRIPLDVDDESCELAVHDHSEVWVEVEVEGTTLSPRTQIAAVPYALEATRASGAAGDLRRELDELVPAGTVIPYAGEASESAVPPGWMLCDGRALSSTDPQYARLFLAIRTAWGNGTDDADGATDFNIPDLRGRFIRGLDRGAGRDPDAAARLQATLGGNAGDLVGTVQPSGTALPTTAWSVSSYSHYHTFQDGATSDGDSSTCIDSSPCQSGSTRSSTDTHSHTITGGDAETRPANAAVNYLIRL